MISVGNQPRTPRTQRRTSILLEVDPPPDLTIEVDITRDSLNRFPIFAAVGIPEIWRFDGTRVIFYQLESKRYVETSDSLAFPALNAGIATQFLEQSKNLKGTVWLRKVRDWAREQNV